MNEDDMQHEENSPLLIKREPVDESDIKDYAETTMNELLGWYGYGKVDSRDTQGLNLHRFTATSSPPPSQLLDGEDGDSSLEGARNNSASPTSSNNGGSSKSADPPNLPPGYIVCAWCQKVGMKLFTLKAANGQKAFCSELCFTQCRRASFKKNKVCDWCKHIRHTVNYVDFQDGEQQLQFCSDKCLNQYKMNIFCRETQAHLQMHPHLQDAAKLAAAVAGASSGGGNRGDGVTLITPELWLRDCHDSLNGHEGPKTDGSGSSSSTKHDDGGNGVPPTAAAASSSNKSKQSSGVCKKTSREGKNNNHRTRHHHRHHHRTPTSTGNKGLTDATNDSSSKGGQTNSGRQASPVPAPANNIPPQLLAAAAAALAANAPTHPHPGLINPSSTSEIPRPPFNPFFPSFPFRPDLLRLPKPPGAGRGGPPPPPPPPFLFPPGFPPGLGAPFQLPRQSQPSGSNPPSHSQPSTASSLLNSLLPPVAVMIPYPVVLPIPLPIPIPLPFPMFRPREDKSNAAESERNDSNNNDTSHRREQRERRESHADSHRSKNRRQTAKWVEKSSTKHDASSSSNARRIDSVITRLPKFDDAAFSSKGGNDRPNASGDCRPTVGDSSSSNGVSSDLSDFPDSDTAMDLGDDDTEDDDEDEEEEEEEGEERLPVTRDGIGKEEEDEKEHATIFPSFSSQENNPRERIHDGEPELKRKCLRARLTAK